MKRVKFLLVSIILVMCAGIITGCGDDNTQNGIKTTDGVSKAASELATNASKGLGELATDVSKGAGELATDIGNGVSKAGDKITGTED